MAKHRELASAGTASLDRARGKEPEWSFVICLASLVFVILGSLFVMAFVKIRTLENSRLKTEESIRVLLKQCDPETMASQLSALGRTLRAAESQACVCPPGPKGDWGPRGERGRRGPEGRRGKDGEKGEKGNQGSRGVDGVQGPPGIDGPRGSMGIPGFPGSPGQQGDIGPQGLPGEPGPAGLRGPRGPSGHRGIPGVNSGDLDRWSGPLPTEGDGMFFSTNDVIHARGIPDNEVTGLSTLGNHGVLDSWEVTISSDSYQMGEDGNVTITRDGCYFIYTNVLFYDSGPYYGATTNINGETFLRCIGSRGSSRHVGFGPCYTSGVAEMSAGDQISIVGDFPMRNVDMRPETTYFGIIRLR